MSPQPPAFPPPPVSDSELEVLKVLWNRGSATVRDVEAGLRRKKHRSGTWAYTTILTLLSRLRDKGYVLQEKPAASADKSAGPPPHLFRPAVSREELLGQGLTELADRICDGTASPLVHALVQSKKLKAADIAALRKLLDQLEGKE